MKVKKNEISVLKVLLLFLILEGGLYGFGNYKNPVNAWVAGLPVSDSVQDNSSQPVQSVKEALAKEPKAENQKVDKAYSEIEAFIRLIFKDEPDLAVAVAKAECQGLKPDCRNYNPPVEISVCHFQINLLAHRDVPGKTIADKEKWLMNPQNCTLMAKIIHDRNGGFRPWSSFTSGRYKKYLGVDD